MKKFVYADNSATTAITPPVLEAMLPYLAEQYGNPSSIYSKGRQAKDALELARQQVATALGCTPEEVFFTGSGTEADNWAIKGVAHAQLKKGKKHIITSVFEHHAVLHSCEALAKEGFEITYLPVYEDGIVRPEDLRAALREDTALVTILYANNEIGTIQPIAEIGAICREKGVVFHTDAVQAIGNIAVDVVKDNIDLLALSGHKLHAPKGVGVLYIRKGVVLHNFTHGGAQENGRRAGTENVASIVALGKAIELATQNLHKNAAHMLALRQQLTEGILKMPHTRLNGHSQKRLPGNSNFSFEGVEGEALLLMLDANGICASSGSACTSGSLDPSHVLLAIGLPHEIAHGSLRLSLGELNTKEDVDYILEALPPVIERLRMMSPTWEKIVAADA